MTPAPAVGTVRRIVLFGATGMVGQGVLLECLRDLGVARVLAVGRRATGRAHPKLRDLVVPDVADLSSVAGELTALDACFFCLGVSSAGLSEARYTALTYDLTLAIAATLVRASPGLKFVYVSGQGTDATVRSRTWWYRALYAALAPALPLLQRRFPQAVTTTAQVGRAMLAVARRGSPTPVLETRDINTV